MLPKLIGPSTHARRPDLVESARRMMLRISPAGLAAAQRGMAERPDSVPTLGTISVPTLILVGEEDSLTGMPDAELMTRHIAGSALRAVPRAGHYAPFEQPEFCAAAMREFLDAKPDLRL
jgi:pimeloyl-ACP methyl ester carboxylesterase